MCVNCFTAFCTAKLQTFRHSHKLSFYNVYSNIIFSCFYLDLLLVL